MGFFLARKVCDFATSINPEPSGYLADLVFISYLVAIHRFVIQIQSVNVTPYINFLVSTVLHLIRIIPKILWLCRSFDAGLVVSRLSDSHDT